MFETFRQHLSSIVELNASELDQIISHAEWRNLMKRELLFPPDGVCEEIVWVQRGCLRLYLIDQSGKEHTICFATENKSISDRISLHQGQPSIFRIDAIEDSEVVILKEKAVVTLMQNIPSFARLARLVTNEMLLDAQMRLTTTLTLRAEDNFRHFNTMFPGLIDRVPLQMIASYLGIDAATLSRIRKKIALQKA